MGLRERVPRSLQPAATNILLKAGSATSQWRLEPSFIVIGGQRCGTTTIFKSLSEHPDVLRPPVDKGTDYYTLNYGRGRDWYRSRMPLAASARLRAGRSGAPQAFEACTYYMFHPLAIERLAKDFPDIKLVAMLRDPVERAYSAYKHEAARGFDPEPQFMRALELEDTRLEGELERIEADVEYESIPHRHWAYRRRGQFAEQLQRVVPALPPRAGARDGERGVLRRPGRRVPPADRLPGPSPVGAGRVRAAQRPCRARPCPKTPRCSWTSTTARPTNS